MLPAGQALKEHSHCWQKYQTFEGRQWLTSNQEKIAALSALRMITAHNTYIVTAHKDSCLAPLEISMSMYQITS